MTTEVVAATPRANLFRRLWPVLKWVLFALVIAFVAQRAWQLWCDGDVGSVTIHWPWLLAASVLYIVGWLPSVLLWHRLIHGLGGSSSRFDVARAYFAGHLAKYIPGKATVLLVRAGMLADRGCRPSVSALTSTYEVLVCMGVGAAVGLTMAPVVWPKTVIDGLPTAIHPAFEHRLIFGIGVVVACVVLVPFVARVLGLIARKLTPPVVTLSPPSPCHPRIGEQLHRPAADSYRQRIPARLVLLLSDHLAGSRTELGLHFASSRSPSLVVRLAHLDRRRFVGVVLGIRGDVRSWWPGSSRGRAVGTTDDSTGNQPNSGGGSDRAVASRMAGG